MPPIAPSAWPITPRAFPEMSRRSTAGGTPSPGRWTPSCQPRTPSGETIERERAALCKLRAPHPSGILTVYLGVLGFLPGRSPCLLSARPSKLGCAFKPPRIVDKYCNFHQAGSFSLAQSDRLGRFRITISPPLLLGLLVHDTGPNRPVKSIERTPFRHAQPRRRRSWGRRLQVPSPPAAMRQGGATLAPACLGTLGKAWQGEANQTT
ncbi:hypothetical protein LZ32DRAFT_316637 [Colletotrichum eremochloae]|nr:hypothetical protein LZ32DRAFT_316637 [Colletotrichum eremochloae]